jgi:hypothetical protein
MGRARNRHNQGEGGVAAAEPIVAASGADDADAAATPSRLRTVGTQTPRSMERRRGGRSRGRQPKGSAERQKAKAKGNADSPPPAPAVLPDADALELPLDVVLAACRHLPARDVASAMCACKSWYGALVRNDELWSRLCADEWDYWCTVGHCTAFSPTVDAPVIPGMSSWHAVFSVRAPSCLIDELAPFSRTEILLKALRPTSHFVASARV